MDNLVIVAIPREDDYIWKISSEKVPHCTICFLGPVEGKPVGRIADFVDHAVNTTAIGPFGLTVDHRGVLGPDEADVLFFKKSWSLRRLEEFRGQLLNNTDIRDAYDSISQYDVWSPHLTLGYPETPANEDKRDYPGFNWIEFDRIAVWTGNFEGPEFRLEYDYNDDFAEVAMSSAAEQGRDFLEHFGVKGMKWGVTQKVKTSRPGALNPNSPVRRAIDAVKSDKVTRGDKKFERKAGSLGTYIDVHNGMADHVNKHIGALNKKYPEDLTHPKNWEKKAAYDHEVETLAITGMKQSAHNIRNPSGTRSYHADYNRNTGVMKITTKAVKHAADPLAASFEVTVDTTGHVTAIKLVEDSMKQTAERGAEFLEHHGVKGMKWGVRRSQRAVTTSTKTAAGPRGRTKIKAKGGQAHPATPDAIKAATLKQKHSKSGAAALSNNELRELATRMQLEQQVKSLNVQQKSSGKKLAKSLLKEEGNLASQNLRRAGKRKLGKAAVGLAAG